MIYNRFLENMDGFYKGMGIVPYGITRVVVTWYMKKKVPYLLLLRLRKCVKNKCPMEDAAAIIII
jgi:hypothetical protein